MSRGITGYALRTYRLIITGSLLFGITGAHISSHKPTRCRNNLQDPFVKIRTVFHGWRRGKNVAASLIYARPLRGPWLIKNAVVILWTHSWTPRVIGQRGSSRDRRSPRLDSVATGQPLLLHVHLIDCFILLVVRSRLLNILSNFRMILQYETRRPLKKEAIKLWIISGIFFVEIWCIKIRSYLKNIYVVVAPRCFICKERHIQGN